MPTASRSAALRTPTCAIAVCTIHLLACEAISQKARAAAGVASTCAVAILVGVSDIARSTATSAASAQVALGVALPWLLAFAAGAMMYVVIEDLIPETAQGRHTNLSTVSFAIGFVLMMAMDVVLG